MAPLSIRKLGADTSFSLSKSTSGSKIRVALQDDTSRMQATVARSNIHLSRPRADPRLGLDCRVPTMALARGRHQ
eukprot:scaffold74073_cov36-Tisochrysis_lutea.AAC.3